MKNSAQGLTVFFIVVLLALRMILIFEPFEWQRKANEHIDYQQFMLNRDTEEQIRELNQVVRFETDWESNIPLDGK